MDVREITDVAELAELPASSVVRTGKTEVRVKTDDGDEWDMVMSSEEVLNDEGGGRVLLVSHPSEWWD